MKKREFPYPGFFSFFHRNEVLFFFFPLPLEPFVFSISNPSMHINCLQSSGSLMCNENKTPLK